MKRSDFERYSQMNDAVRTATKTIEHTKGTIGSYGNPYQKEYIDRLKEMNDKFIAEIRERQEAL